MGLPGSHHGLIARREFADAAREIYAEHCSVFVPVLANLRPVLAATIPSV